MRLQQATLRSRSYRRGWCDGGRSSPLCAARSRARGRARARRSCAPGRAGRRDAGAAARQAQRYPADGRARACDQGGARAVQGALADQRPGRRRARIRRRWRACRAGRHGGRGRAIASRTRGDHRAFGQDPGAGRGGAGRSHRLCRRRRRIRDVVQGQYQAADRPSRAHAHRRNLPPAGSEVSAVRHRRHRREQCGRGGCGRCRRGRGDLGALARRRSAGRGARVARHRGRRARATGALMTAIAVTIAGSDSGGGAGIQADLKTFSALGVYGASVVTALTAQNTKGVSAIHDVPAEFVAAQMDAVFSDLDVGAVKIGMVSQSAVIETIAAGLERWRQSKVVLDPVMIATSGDKLLAPDAIDTLKRVLIPRALVITPNLPEAAALLDAPIASSETQMREQAERLLALGPKSVLIKGGHGTGAESVDLLVEPTAFTRLAADRIATQSTHGTGCTLSSAIAAGLAKGLGLAEAVAAAKAYVTAAIAAAGRIRIGSGPGPVH